MFELKLLFEYKLKLKLKRRQKRKKNNGASDVPKWSVFSKPFKIIYCNNTYILQTHAHTHSRILAY